MKLEYLPPYSPDLNPIELAFSAMKAYLARHDQEVWEAMAGNEWIHVQQRIHCFNDAVFNTDAAKARGFFQKCGYL